MEMNKVDSIIDAYNADPAFILEMMYDIQDEAQYVSRENMERIAEKLELPVAKVLRLATFYDSINLEPQGKHVCKVCTGTSCHVNGAEKVLHQVEKDLNVKAGGTTEDKIISLKEVSCMGACASGPLAQIDDEYHENITPDKIKQAVDQLRQK